MKSASTNKKILVVSFLIILLISSLIYSIFFPWKDNSLAKVQNFSFFKRDQIFKINYGGQDRLWISHISKKYDGKISVPLVINLHGAGGSAESAKNSSGMNNHSDKEGYIVVYPEATGKKILGKVSGYWNVDVDLGRNTDTRGVNDVGFINKIIDEMSSKYKIDQKRIYVTGLSRGGMMAYYLACQPNSRIAAIAPVSSTFVNNPALCETGRSIPVIHFHGTADRVLPYNGGYSDKSLPDLLQNNFFYLSAKNSVEVFAKKNNCPMKQQVVYTKGNVSCSAYNGCPRQGNVVLCTVRGGGHTWPGGSYEIKSDLWKNLVGEINRDISANEIMWEFFKAHPLP